MVHSSNPPRHPQSSLSVLALSSRFDGLASPHGVIFGVFDFQYSLCRVVLMVDCPQQYAAPVAVFQYSLCRVVLMVLLKSYDGKAIHALSVLALSSRFDGPPQRWAKRSPVRSFSTRSVESF